jgi:hypothetical protein
MDIIYVGKEENKDENNNSNSVNNSENTEKKATKKKASKKKAKVVKDTVNDTKSVDTENSTSGLSEEEQMKRDFRLSSKAEKLLDDYYNLLEDYLVDLDEYKKKDEDVKINTLEALMNQEEIADK